MLIRLRRGAGKVNLRPDEKREQAYVFVVETWYGGSMKRQFKGTVLVAAAAVMIVLIYGQSALQRFAAPDAHAAATPAPTPTPAPPPPLPLTTPGNFQAKTANGNAVVTLTWEASTGTSSAITYTLDDSTDQVNWANVATGLVVPNFRDDSAAYGIHYYYRVRATDAAGEFSAYATVDLVTPNFMSNTAAAGPTSYYSGDNRVMVLLPSGALVGSGSECSVEVDPRKIATAPGQKVVAGPYSFVCKDEHGQEITSLLQPITWTYALANKLGGTKSVTALLIGSLEQKQTIQPTLDKKTGVLAFNVAETGTTAVLAYQESGASLSILNTVLSVLAVLGLGVAFFAFDLRRKQAADHKEEVLAKYGKL